MDVRCEKCQALYVVDDTHVEGTMARCSRCGHTFALRRVSVPRASGPVRAISSSFSDANRWQLRAAATGDVLRFEDLATLRQWILERRVGRDDAISRSGDQWRRLGDVPELASLFNVIEESRRSSPSRPHPIIAGPSARLPAGGAPRVSEQMLAVPMSRLGLKITGAVAALVILAIGGYLVGAKWDALRGCGGGGRAAQAYVQGMQQFLLDADANFHMAEQFFQRAHGASESSARPVAALAELNAQWASYLEDDARFARGAGRADELRKEARLRLETAKRHADEALALGTETAEANRAMAAFLIASGAPVTQVEFFLERSGGAKGHAAHAFLRGALALREGRNDDARRFLEEASEIERAKTQHELIRAEYLLARMDLAAGRFEAAKLHAQRILTLNPIHDRARALLAALPSLATTAPRLEAPPAGQAQPAPLAPPLPTAKGQPASSGTPGAAPSEAAKSVKAAAREEPDVEPKDYDALVRHGNRLAENGRTREAQSAFEKALALNGGGVEAMVGLGYVYLDTEHQQAAIEQFRRALDRGHSSEALIGLAEAYKIRGNKAKALEYYRRYVSEFPAGGKVGMAQRNVRELEPETKPAGGEQRDDKAE